MKKDIKWKPFRFDFQKSKNESISEYERLEMERDGDFDRLMETPFGTFKIDDSMNPFKTFDFYIGDTNFKITRRVFTVLNNVLGVESLNILSPYRFIISCGRAFDWRDVQCQIEHELCGWHVSRSLIKTISNQDVQEQVYKLYEKIRLDSLHWLIYVFPNGNISHQVYTNLKSFQSEAKLYSEVKRVSNGLLISSEDDNGNE